MSIIVNTNSNDKRNLIIQSILKRPRLYKNEFLRKPQISRSEKQKIWDEIAKECGFVETETAKIIWRQLLLYLRQHLLAVAQKKLRRYAPNSKNPNYKYVQLTDWRFYKPLESIVPLVKFAILRKRQKEEHFPIKMTESEMRLISKGLNSNEPNKVKECEPVKIIHHGFLTSEEKNLKEFFENMLSKTMSLPIVEQLKIRHNLQKTIQEIKNN